MRDCTLRVAVGGEQLSGANVKWKCVLRGERLQYFFFRERSDDVARGLQCLLQWSHFRLDISHELTIEITLSELQALLQHVWLFCCVAIHREHAQDRVEAVTLGDKLTHLRRLKVCDRKVLRRLRPLA